ncbi:reverse transcriptase domain-containing protein [Tanacetum coccineum]
MPGAEMDDPDNAHLLAEEIIDRAEAKEAAERKRKMAIDEKQFHQEPKTEMKGMQKSPDATEIKKTVEEDDADDVSSNQLIKDEEEMAMLPLSRKKRDLLKPFRKERKRANVDTLERRKKNLKKNQETYRNPSERLKVQDRLRFNDRLGHRRQSAFDRLSDTYSPSTTKSGPDRANSRDRSHGRSRPYRRDSSNRDRPQCRDCSRDVEESYDNSRFSYGTGTKHGYHFRDRDRSRYVKRRRESESPISRVSKNGTSDGVHYKSKSKRHKPTDEDDLAVSWICEEVDPFTPRIRNFKSARKTRMPNNMKTYDGTGDPEDHVKNFQAAAQLPPESIDGYKDLKAAFLAYFMQQKKYVKDLVEIHNIKQRDGETIEDFMERFKVETGRMKGASECMWISGFMHGVNNPELTKCLNEHVPKTTEEMMIVTTTFIRGEAAAAGKKKGHASWRAHDQSKRHASERMSDFRGSSNRRDAIRERTDKTMLTPKEKLGYICMAAVRHDRSTVINSGTSTQYSGMIFTRSTEEKGPGPGACESHPSGDTETSRGMDHERSLLP